MRCIMSWSNVPEERQQGNSVDNVIGEVIVMTSPQQAPADATTKGQRQHGEKYKWPPKLRLGSSTPTQEHRLSRDPRM